MRILDEKINFNIEFDSIYWDRPPIAKISIDDQCFFDDAITENKNTVNFSHVLVPGEHSLVIIRSNKSDDQVRLSNNLDQILIIKRILIDGIDIENLIYTRGYFSPSYPKIWYLQQIKSGIHPEEKVLAETTLSHNGTWSLIFKSPFYKFLIDNMNNEL